MEDEGLLGQNNNKKARETAQTNIAEARKHSKF
jgi:hypothetical protein